ncbi:MAG: hypothetical protein RMM31_10720, partial [Anaerolineae bacterium]|nr:hypothetical protein [Anaerolineae bacterium]
AQRGAEERIARLEVAVAALIEAQRRTEQRLDMFMAEFRRFREEEFQELKAKVDRLQQTFGATLEEEAASVLEVVMRKKGFRALGPETTLSVDGEIDVLMPFENPQGQRVWILVEVKARLNQRDVRAWIQRARDAAWQSRLAERGVDKLYCLYFYAIRVDLGALELIESSEGVGLLKSEGEIVAPRGLTSLL